MVIFGLSGSGKSFLSRMLAEEMGFLWLRSDVIRKRLAGMEPQQSARAPFGEGIYAEEMTRRVYEEMIETAKRHVREGKRVVLDATFLRRWQRDLVRLSFDSPLFILATAPEEVVRERIRSRRDISDADFAVFLRQKEIFEPPEEIDYVEVNTDRSPEELRSILKDVVEDDC